MRMSFAEALTALRGIVTGGSASALPAITGISTDNRHTGPGDLFFCIRGGQFDGRDFAPDAIERGAVAVVTEKPLSIDAPVVLVDDIVIAFGRLAHAWRKRTQARVIGVTGTAGKTTVKELLAAVLSAHGPTARNALNLNNQFGLPRSILATNGDERFWVMEAGISKAGDMDALGTVLAPDIALVLNAGSGHTEGLGAHVAVHKARLLHWLSPKGVGIVCADYPELVQEAQKQRRQDTRLEFFTAFPDKAHSIPVGHSVRYLGPVPVQQGVLSPFGRFYVRMGGWAGEMTAPFRGTYGAENVAAVCAVASVLGFSAETLATGLAQAVLPQQRFQCTQLGAWLMVDDSYNANPLSSTRMIESAADLATHTVNPNGGATPLVCVLGEMLELGALAAKEHEALGVTLAHNKVRLVLWKGGHAVDVQRGLCEGGFQGVFAVLAGAEVVFELIKNHHVDGGVILFKGSRSNRIEDCVNAFKAAVETMHAV